VRHRVRWLVVPVLVGLGVVVLTRPALPREALAAPTSSLTAAAARRSVDTVTVVFQCQGTRSASPWAVTLTSAQDSVVWVIDPASDVEEIEIEPKRNALGLRPWPFERGERMAARGRPAVQFAPRSGRRTYRYNIVAMCPGPGNSLRRTVYDPDIIIDF
jgi:hypothetical protein